MNIISTHIDIEAFRQVIQEEIAKSQKESNPVIPPKQAKMLNVDELAEYLGLKKSTIYSLVHFRKIPFYKTGKKLIFDPLEVQLWIKSHRCSTESEINSK